MLGDAYTSWWPSVQTDTREALTSELQPGLEFPKRSRDGWVLHCHSTNYVQRKNIADVITSGSHPNTISTPSVLLVAHSGQASTIPDWLPQLPIHLQPTSPILKRLPHILQLFINLMPYIEFQQFWKKRLKMKKVKISK